MGLFNILLAMKLIIVFTFLVSSAGKLRDMSDFKTGIENFRLLPEHMTPAASWIIVVGEIIVVLLIVSGGLLALAGFMLAIAILSVFSVALSTVLYRGQQISCNCFGSSNNQVTVFDVFRNGILIAVCLIGIGVLEFTYFQSSEAMIFTALVSMNLSILIVNIGVIGKLYRNQIALT